MPKGRYTIGGKGTHGCTGYPVVGDTGKVHGCHKTKEGARAQQAAIYTSTSKGESYDVDSAIKKNSDLDCCPEVNDFEKAKGPCWDGYEQVGFKMQDGKKVPNCVKVDTNKASDNEDQTGEGHDKKKKKRMMKSGSIIENHPDCSGFAIVSEDGTLDSCHKTRAEAEAAMAQHESPDSEMQNPGHDTNKFWEGSNFVTRRR